MKPFAENKFAKFWIDDHTVHFIYNDGVYVDFEAAQKIVQERLQIQKGKSYPVFCDMTGLVGSDKNARDYLANEGSKLVKAVAALVSNPMTRMMLNFYLKINKPKTPTRSFTKKADALEFLKTYIEEVV